MRTRRKIGLRRKFHEHAYGAGEPVWKLNWDAHHARKALRDEARLPKKVHTWITQMKWLERHQRQLLDDLYARRLQVRVEVANTAYEHGSTQTHDFGFKLEENIWRDDPSR